MHDIGFASVSTFFDELGDLMAPPPATAFILDMAAFFEAIGPTRIPVPAHRVFDRPTLTAANLIEFLAGMEVLPATTRRLTPTFNIWDVTGIGRSEVRNTAILAWALNPRGSHGKGPDVFNALLARARRDWTATGDAFPFPSEVSRYSIRTEACPFSDQANRVDIVADGPDFTTFIEVKISAIPDPDQVRRYLELSKTRAAATGRARHGVLFLEPRWARILPDLGPHVVPITWHDVADAVVCCVTADSDGLTADTALQQFADHVRSF